MGSEGASGSEVYSGSEFAQSTGLNEAIASGSDSKGATVPGEPTYHASFDEAQSSKVVPLPPT